MKKTGAILAGGKSSRMGEDKAFLNIQGKKFIDVALSCFEDFEEVIIISNNKDKYKDYNVKVYEDLIKDIGPMGGIYTALKVAKYDIVLVACDMPHLNKEIINQIANNIKDKSVVSSIDGYIQPLCSAYKKDILNKVEESINNKNYKLKMFLNNIDKEILEFDDKRVFTNINTKEDYKNNI